MQLIYNIRKRFLPYLFIGVTALLLTSCGTYTPSYSDTDGIYSSGENVAVEEGTTDRGNYYKQYFSTKANELEGIPEDEDLVFTDIEAYTTSEYMDDEGYIVIEERNDYNEGYGPWGTNSGDVTINIHDNGFGYGYGYWGSPYWTYNYGFPGYGYYGYYNPYRSYWGFGGWGYPYYGGYFGPHDLYLWGGSYYYGGYNHYGHGGYYGNGYNHGISYNRGRRSTDYYNRSESRGRSSDATNSRRSYSRSEINRRTQARRSNSNSARRSSFSRRSNTSARRSNSKAVRNFNSRSARRSNTSSRRSNYNLSLIHI